MIPFVLSLRVKAKSHWILFHDKLLKIFASSWNRSPPIIMFFNFFFLELKGIKICTFYSTLYYKFRCRLNIQYKCTTNTQKVADNISFIALDWSIKLGFFLIISSMSFERDIKIFFNFSYCEGEYFLYIWLYERMFFIVSEAFLKISV